MTVGIAANGSVAGILRQHRHDVLIERLAGAARFLAAVENGDRLDGRGQRGQECACIEWPIQANLDHADLFALLASAASTASSAASAPEPIITITRSASGAP